LEWLTAAEVFGMKADVTRIRKGFWVLGISGVLAAIVVGSYSLTSLKKSTKDGHGAWDEGGHRDGKGRAYRR